VKYPNAEIDVIEILVLSDVHLKLRVLNKDQIEEQIANKKVINVLRIGSSLFEYFENLSFESFLFRCFHIDKYKGIWKETVLYLYNNEKDPATRIPSNF
jgi:hypothetical protein